MIKLRVQGTKKDIRSFIRILMNSPGIKLGESSEIYSNKGTDRYFRWYADIDFVNEKEDNENE